MSVIDRSTLPADSRQEKKAWLKRVPNDQLARQLRRVAIVVTGLVLILVGLMRRPELKIALPDGVSLSYLPSFHAILNTLVAVLLIVALVAIIAGQVALHRRLIMSAMALSVVFLLSYVIYHFTHHATIYGDIDKDGILTLTEREALGVWRTVYLVLLISHITLAALSLPAILFTFIEGFCNRFKSHKRLARWVFPVWLYVAVTGPICWLMLRPYY